MGLIYLSMLVVDWAFVMILEYIILPRDRLDYVERDWNLERFRG